MYGKLKKGRDTGKRVYSTPSHYRVHAVKHVVSTSRLIMHAVTYKCLHVCSSERIRHGVSYMLLTRMRILKTLIYAQIKPLCLM